MHIAELRSFTDDIVGLYSYCKDISQITHHLLTFIPKNLKETLRMLKNTVVNVVFKSWVRICEYWNVIFRLSGASWVSILRCGRTRNPKTGAECSRSWSAIGSTAPSPADIPPRPTWNNSESFWPCQSYLNEICLYLAFLKMKFWKIYLNKICLYLAFLKPILACCIRTDRLSVMLI